MATGLLPAPMTSGMAVFLVREIPTTMAPAICARLATALLTEASIALIAMCMALAVRQLVQLAAVSTGRKSGTVRMIIMATVAGSVKGIRITTAPAIYACLVRTVQ